MEIAFEAIIAHDLVSPRLFSSFWHCNSHVHEREESRRKIRIALASGTSLKMSRKGGSTKRLSDERVYNIIFIRIYTQHGTFIKQARKYKDLRLRRERSGVNRANNRKEAQVCGKKATMSKKESESLSSELVSIFLFLSCALPQRVRDCPRSGDKKKDDRREERRGTWGKGESGREGEKVKEKEIANRRRRRTGRKR